MVPSDPAAQQHRVFAHVGGEEVVGVGYLALVSQKQPAAREDPFQLLLVDVPGDEDAAVEEPLSGIHEIVQLVHPVTP